MRKHIPETPATQGREGEGYATAWPKPQPDTQRELEAEKAAFRARYPEHYNGYMSDWILG